MADLASQPTSVQTVYTWYRENKLFVNRRYQRKLVWTLEEKQKLIESILKKYPIPAILLAERDGSPGTYEIIDGLQRLHSIVSFIENSFPLVDERYFNVDQFPTAKRRMLNDSSTGKPDSSRAALFGWGAGSSKNLPNIDVNRRCCSEVNRSSRTNFRLTGRRLELISFRRQGCA